MSKEEYNQCIKPYMTGKGKSKEERQLSMCIGAKLCTNKASTEEEAEKICRETPPKNKEPRSKKPRKGKAEGQTCSTQAPDLADCLIKHMNPDKFKESLIDAVITCICKTGVCQ